MSKSKNLYIFGYSGHSYVVLDVALALGYSLKGYFDLRQASVNPYSIAYLGNENYKDVAKIINGDFIFPAVGSNAIRNELFKFSTKNGLNQTVLIDPNAFVSAKTGIGNSTFVAPKAAVNSGTKIGNACIINTGAIIEHECNIDDFVHIGPGAVLAGNVNVKANAFLGANSVVKQGVSIGNNTLIGAGAVVITDIPDGEIWAGNPAKRIK